jgi:hypothetical protein
MSIAAALACLVPSGWAPEEPADLQVDLRLLAACGDVGQPPLVRVSSRSRVSRRSK